MGVKSWLTGVINAALPDAGAPAKEATFREAYGSGIDPDEALWRPLTGDASRDLTPLTQQRMQKIAHYLWESNLLANRLIELPMAFLLAEGVSLSVGGDKEDTERVDNQAQLDRFWTDPINEMDLKLPKKVRELALFGEQCYPAFVNEHDGMVRIGYLDPSLIETVVMDPDNPEQPIGVVTRKSNKGIARRYRVIINGDEDVFTARTQEIRKTFTDGDAFYFRVNDLSSGTRGRSDLLAQADWLDAFDEFMFGELDRNKFLRAFLWDLQLKNATQDQVDARAAKVVLPKSGGVYVHNDSETLEPKVPDLKTTDSEKAARLFRNHILGGATVPEHWFGGGGDVNRATAAEMDTPTLKIFSMRQRFLKHMLESIGRYVLFQRAKAENVTADFSKPAWKVEASFPELAAGDTSKYAAAFSQLVAGAAQAIDRGLLSKKTAVMLINAIAGRLGVEIDAEEELAQAQEEAKAAAEADTFTTPPAAKEDAAAAAAATAGPQAVD